MNLNHTLCGIPEKLPIYPAGNQVHFAGRLKSLFEWAANSLQLSSSFAAVVVISLKTLLWTQWVGMTSQKRFSGVKPNIQGFQCFNADKFGATIIKSPRPKSYVFVCVYVRVCVCVLICTYMCVFFHKQLPARMLRKVLEFCILQKTHWNPENPSVKSTEA